MITDTIGSVTFEYGVYGVHSVFLYIRILELVDLTKVQLWLRLRR